MSWFARAITIFVRTPNLYSLLDRQRRALLRGEKKLTKELLAAYRNYEAALQERLNRVARLIHGAKLAGTEINPSWLMEQAQVRELLIGIRAETQRFTEAAATAIAQRQKQLVGLATADAAALTKATGVIGSLTRVPVQQLQDLVGILGSGSPLRQIFEEFGDQAVRGAFVTLTKTVGQGPAAIARELRKEVDGLSKRRALLIARSETNRTYRTATLRNFAANADVISGWRWASARDRRTCPICLAMDGSEHPVTEHMATHPACRCSMVPIVRGYTPVRKSGEEWLREQPEDVQRSVLGKTRYVLWSSGQLSMRDLVQPRPNVKWGPSTVLKPLRQLRIETALGILGERNVSGDGFAQGQLVKTVKPSLLRKELRRIESEFELSPVEVLHVLRPNGEIWQFPGTRTEVRISQADLDTLFGGAIITHPHPGRTKFLSAHDILLAIDADVKEIRATVTRQGAVRFSPGRLEEWQRVEARKLAKDAYREALTWGMRRAERFGRELKMAEVEVKWSKILRMKLKANLGIRFTR